MRASRILALFASLGAAAAHSAPLPESQRIDAMLVKEWAANQVKPNPPASDEVLVRRFYLDIIGRIPTLEETEAFVRSTEPEKRKKLIDQLFASDGCTSHLFNYWADILRLTDQARGRVAAQAYAEHVKRCLKENKPYDQFVYELLTAEGDVWDSGAVGFYLRDDNKLDHLAYTTQVFLGTQIICAQCHNHPFDKWSQMEYYGLAAFTYSMGVKGYSDPYGFNKPGANEAPRMDEAQLRAMGKAERGKYLAAHPEQLEAQKKKEQDLEVVSTALRSVMKSLIYTSINLTGKPLTLPADYKYPDGNPGQVIQPKTLFGHGASQANGAGRLQTFADWMTSPENPRFTLVIANRLWKKVFGLGLIEPVDEMTDSSTASNGELMEYLTQIMREKKYSLKSYLRVLYNTDAYQRMATTGEAAPGEPCHFTGPLLHRMNAEQVWDSIVTLSKGNLDSTTSEENERLHQYLGDLKALMSTVREKGLHELAEMVSQRAAKPAEAAPRTKSSPSDIVVALIGEGRARDLMQGYKPTKAPALPPEIDKAALAAMSKGQRATAIALATQFTLDARASELPSPERPGHFLRAFGQSDRDQISNANEEPSVPQALALLNGPTFEALSNPQCQLQQNLAKAQTTAQKIDLLYRCFLSRPPNATERVVLAQVIHERGDKAVADVTQALLTGGQFLFVQ